MITGGNEAFILVPEVPCKPRNKKQGHLPADGVPSERNPNRMKISSVA